MGRSEGRPEHAAPPEIFYDSDEASKYTSNTRMMAIQASLTERALELLNLPTDSLPKLLLDLGCGSGLSGESITEAGHSWVGFDISPAMLDVANEREVEGDLCLLDLGHGLPIRPGIFDGAISISALQWLCNADSSRNDPRKRLKRFFETLYACLAKGARAALQIYPENVDQASMLVNAAMRVGFTGGLVVDYPNSTRAKKYYLVLMVGSSASIPSARGMDGEDPEEEEETGVRVAGRDRRGAKRRKGASGNAHGKSWILKKKNQMRGKGYTSVPKDTKYTGRKRKDRI